MITELGQAICQTAFRSSFCTQSYGPTIGVTLVAGAGALCFGFLSRIKLPWNMFSTTPIQRLRRTVEQIHGPFTEENYINYTKKRRSIGLYHSVSHQDQTLPVMWGEDVSKTQFISFHICWHKESKPSTTYMETLTVFQKNIFDETLTITKGVFKPGIEACDTESVEYKTFDAFLAGKKVEQVRKVWCSNTKDEVDETYTFFLCNPIRYAQVKKAVSKSP